jgi:two-component system, LytTR family, response regulator
VRKLRALIVDDEPLARDTLRLLLRDDAEVELVGECSGADAIALIEKTPPDILFLDVQMPEVNGFDVLEAIGTDAVPGVVFVTAYDEYAVRAFDVHAVDYLLKPFDDARFARALARVKARARLGKPDERLPPLIRDHWQLQRRFVVRARDRMLVVPADEVDWIEAADYYASLHVGPKTHLVRQSLTELAQRLDPEHFVRVHRSAIVNVDRVREIQRLEHGDCVLVLGDGAQVKLSRTRRRDFDRLFSGSRVECSSGSRSSEESGRKDE